MTSIRPQSAPAGPRSAGGNVTQSLSQTQTALRNPNLPANKKKRNRQHIQQQQPVKGPRPKMTMPAYAQLLLVGAAVGVSSLFYLRYFSTLGFLIATLSMTVAGVLIGAVAALRRWPLLTTAGVGVIGFLVVAVFAVFRDTLSHGIPTGKTLSSLGRGLLSGWKEMLSVTLPADSTGVLEATPALVCFVAAIVSASLVLRSKSLLAPALPPVAAFMAALPFTAPRPVGGMVLIGVLLAVVLVLTLVRAGASDPMARTINARAAWGRFLFGLPVVLVAVAAGLAGMRLVPLADSDDRFDLRTVVKPELDIQDQINPLGGVKPQLKGPNTDLFTVKVSGSDTTGIDRVRMIALENYDGAMWGSKNTFLTAGKSLTPDDTLRDPRKVTLSVQITTLPGPYLPEVGAPVSVTGTSRIGFDSDSGTLATDQPMSGLTYDLVAEVGQRSGLDKSVPLAATDERFKLPREPQAPDVILKKAQELAGNVAEPYAKLLAIQKFMQTFPYNLEARPGHAYDKLARLFGANPNEQVGYAEQFAAAFAVLARAQGFTSRVAVGYLLNKDRKNGDTYQVKTSDAHAWAEVNMAGYGWVTFEPTDPNRHPANVNKPKDNETPAENNKPQQNSTASQPDEDPNLPNLAGGGLSPWDITLWVMIGVLALVLLTPIIIGIEKVRRRRQRHSGSRAARIIGAWEQATDRLIEYGVPVTAASTANEVTEQARERFGSEGTGSLAVLAPIVTAAVFNPNEPDDNTVQEAWQLEGQLRRELRQTRSPLLTVRAWLDPRPLFARWRDERRRRRALDRLTRG